MFRRATFRLRFPSGVTFTQTVKELGDETEAGAVRHARRILRKCYPSARLRLLSVTWDHVSEEAAKKREATP